jgi:hypothetical protein
MSEADIIIVAAAIVVVGRSDIRGELRAVSVNEPLRAAFSSRAGQWLA